MNKAVKLLNQNLKEEEQTRTKLEAMSRKLKPDNLGIEEEEEQEKRPARRSPASVKKGRSRRAA